MSKYWNEIQNSSLEKREEEGGNTATVLSNSKNEVMGLLNLEKCSQETHSLEGLVMNRLPLPKSSAATEENWGAYRGRRQGRGKYNSFVRQTGQLTNRQARETSSGGISRGVNLFLSTCSLPLSPPLNVCNNFRFRCYRIWRVNFSSRSLFPQLTADLKCMYYPSTDRSFIDWYCIFPSPQLMFVNVLTILSQHIRKMA